jgi:hypothetical protein
MSLEEKIRNDLTTAMKAKEVLRVSVIRMLLSELNYKKIDLQRDLTDQDIFGVIAKEVKKRKEAVESFTAGGRVEQAAGEQKEAEILSLYLPAQMSEEEILIEVAKIIKTLRDEEKKNFGQVMRAVTPVLRGKADGAIIARVVKDILG